MTSHLRMLRPDTTSRRWAALLIALLALALLLPSAPSYQPLPNQDAGVFLYIGRAVLEGDVPYRDVWDHKPPGIYFVNALGLALGGGSIWGVWVLELLSFTAAGWLSYALLRRQFGPLVALVASVSWMTPVMWLLEGGNMTGEFVLPLQFAGIYLFFDAERQGSYGWRGWGIGATGMLAFLLRPNAVGIWIAIVIVAVIMRQIAGQRRTSIREVASIAAGTIAVAGPVLIYLLASGAIGEFWDQVVTFNRETANVEAERIMRGAIRGIEELSRTSLPIIGIAGWGIVVITWTLRSHGLPHATGAGPRRSARPRLRRRRTRQRPSPHMSSEHILPAYVAGLVFVAMPIEIFLATGTREDFPHHYLSWLPILGLLVAVFAHVTTGSATFRNGVASGLRWPPSIAIIWLGGLLFALNIAALDLYWDRATVGWRAMTLATAWRVQAADSITRLTDRGDEVLIWGSAGDLLFVTDRRSSVRFLSLSPYFGESHQKEERFEELMATTKAAPPQLVIDGSANTAGGFSGMESLQNFVGANYEFIETVGGYHQIYRLRPPH